MTTLSPWGIALLIVIQAACWNAAVHRAQTDDSQDSGAGNAWRTAAACVLLVTLSALLHGCATDPWAQAHADWAAAHPPPPPPARDPGDRVLDLVGAIVGALLQGAMH